MNRSTRDFAIIVLVFLGVTLIVIDLLFRWSVQTEPAYTVNDIPPTRAPVLNTVKTAIDNGAQAVSTAVYSAPRALAPSVVVETAVPAAADCSGWSEVHDDFWIDTCGNPHPYAEASTWEDYATRAIEHGVAPDPKPADPEPFVQESDRSVDALGGEYDYLNWDGNAEMNCTPGEFTAHLNKYYDCYGDYFATKQEAVESYNSYGHGQVTTAGKSASVDAGWETENYSAGFVQDCAQAAAEGRRSHPNCADALRELGPGR